MSDNILKNAHIQAQVEVSYKDLAFIDTNEDESYFKRWVGSRLGHALSVELLNSGHVTTTVSQDIENQCQQYRVEVYAFNETRLQAYVVHQRAKALDQALELLGDDNVTDAPSYIKAIKALRETYIDDEAMFHEQDQTERDERPGELPHRDSDAEQ